MERHVLLPPTEDDICPSREGSMEAMVTNRRNCARQRSNVNTKTGARKANLGTFQHCT